MHIRHVQQSSERKQKEIVIRYVLAQWDYEFPLLRHELLVRCAAGHLAAAAAFGFYSIIWGIAKGDNKKLY